MGATITNNSAPTWEPIAINYGSGTQTISFSSIPQTYTDLVLVCKIVNGGSGGGNMDLVINGNSSNSSGRRMLGYVNATDSGTSTNRMMVGDPVTGDYSTSIINIFNYTNTNHYKTVLSRGSTRYFVAGYVGCWRDTSAINSLSLTYTIAGGSLTFATGTTITLYGIKAA